MRKRVGRNGRITGFIIRIHERRNVFHMNFFNSSPMRESEVISMSRNVASKWYSNMQVAADSSFLSIAGGLLSSLHVLVGRVNNK